MMASNVPCCSAAREAGVNSTPTVFINGRQQRNRSLEGFSAAVEAELKKLAAKQ
jgi:protein-disulfide isomerase